MAALALPAGGATFTGPNTTTAPPLPRIRSGPAPTWSSRRAHGQKGSFVSRYSIDELFMNHELRETQGVVPNGAGTNPTTGETFPAYSAAFARWCSSSLTDPYQLLNFRTGRGFAGQIYFGNEASGNEGRVFGVTTEGQAQQLPRLGLFSWENTFAARNQSDTTLVMGNEDGADGQLWAYAGTKGYRGTPFDKAGLTNGIDYVVRVGGGPLSDAGVRAAITASPNKKVAFDLTEVPWNQSGAEQNAEAKAEGLTLNRIEDGAWDPKNKNVFYFLTTEGGVGATPARDGGGLWRLTYADIENPLAGGTLELLLNGSESIGLSKPDNLTIDADGGHILIQEDPGNIATSPGSSPTASPTAGPRCSPASTRPCSTRPSPARISSLRTRSRAGSSTSPTSGSARRPTRRRRWSTPTTCSAGARAGRSSSTPRRTRPTGLDNPTAQVERGQLYS